jgi:hypothetical protein
MPAMTASSWIPKGESGRRLAGEIVSPLTSYRSIFAPSTSAQRVAAFDDYLVFTRDHSGELLEEEKTLTKKREKLQYFQQNPVRLHKPFPNPEGFYRNYVKLKDDPANLDRKTLLMTCIYKFARHEWVGITGAWAATPEWSECESVTDRITRYHLAEEFCHIRLFHEMFVTLGLDKIEWVSLGPIGSKIYELFPRLPDSVLSPPAFVTELMGVTFYRRLDCLLDSVFDDEPEARQRIRELLHEITIDEVAHAGQRRNYMGPLGTKVSRWMIPALFRAFFRDIPETRILLDVEQMIRDARSFDYGQIPEELLAESWAPSYCTVRA